ncbi:hypothetical protein [Algiphilus aromaticivorans]|uniref:hypothetical protein n=1 Tax=Algiphilus aromaticivorans TaxID=382454 RepID=UPI0005C1A7AA|nr:hypothetical protein [Algiphilus aromaticivorans]
MRLPIICRCWLAVGILLMIVCPSVGAQAAPEFGSHRFHVGGYGEIMASDTQRARPQLALQRLSVIGSWASPGRWSGLIEVEGKQLLVLRPADSGVDDARPVLERAYIDFAQSNALQLRLGKFLTPIGRWNQLHAAPLTWTTSRPLITEDTFPLNTTGGMLRGVVPVLGQALEWSLFASPGEELFPESGASRFEEAFGLRLAQDLGPHLQVGLSVSDFKESRDRERKTLFSMDFLYARSGFELSGEFAVRQRSRTTRNEDETGLYLQGVAPIGGPFFAVARIESFAGADAADDLHLYIAGLTMRWSRQLVLKAEYRHTTENPGTVAEGLLGSVALFF